MKQITPFVSLLTLIGILGCDDQSLRLVKHGGKLIYFSTLPEGSFPVYLENHTRGKWRDDQIYIEILSLDAPNLHEKSAPRLTYLAVTNDTVLDIPEGTGTLAVLKPTQLVNDDAVLGLNKKQLYQQTRAFTLSQLQNKTVYLPGDGKFYCAQVYVSFGKPLNLQWAHSRHRADQTSCRGIKAVNNAIPYQRLEFRYDRNATPKVPFTASLPQARQLNIALLASATVYYPYADNSRRWFSPAFRTDTKIKAIRPVGSGTQHAAISIESPDYEIKNIHINIGS